MKSLLSSTLFFAFSILILISCKDDDAAPKLQFQTDNKTISLKDAKLYLRIQGGYEGAVDYTYRDYLISDGELLPDKNGFSLDHYTNATYFIALELAIAEPDPYTADSYTLHRFWDNVTDGSNLSYIFAGFEDKTVDTPDSGTKSAITIKGGLEPGQTMTIAFDGEIAYRSGSGTLTPFAGKLNFMGIVIDKRD
jgi:hypothetical protein